MLAIVSSVIFFLYKYMILFAFGTISGWVIELVWRRFFEDRRWINPGFLQGPWLPIYGFGTIFLYLLCSLPVPIYILMIFFLLSMTILEYVAGLIFLKYFKIKLWDYSKHWGNIQGIICPLYSILWVLLGLFFNYIIFPVLREMIHDLYNYLNLLFFMGIYAGLFGVDLWQSFDIAGRIRHFFVESGEKGNIDFELLKIELRDRVKEGFRNRTRFFFPFRGEIGANFRDNLLRHTSNISRKLKPIQQALKAKHNDDNINNEKEK